MDGHTRLQTELNRSRAEAQRWEQAYRRLRARPPVRAMAAVHSAGVRLRKRLAPGRASAQASGSAGGPAAVELAPPVPDSPPGTAPFSVPYRRPAGVVPGGLARLDPGISERRFEAFDAALGLFTTGRVVDLGAGHGLLSMRAADAGWQVTAVDARSVRFPTDERVTWVHEDMRSHDLSGYDLILCLGLFYHLTLADQLDLLTRAAGTPILIDTHVDVGIDYPDDRLAGNVEQDGYRGRLYGEHLESPLASWVNEASFWPDLDSFYRMLADHGYPVTLALEPWYQPDRTFFLALPGR